MGATVAVTGASGYVGSNLIPLLLEQGHEVLALDLAPSPHLPDEVRQERADILDLGGMTRLLRGVDTVYHLAVVITLAPTHDLAWRVNTQGVQVAAQAALAAGVRRFVYGGSVHSFDQRSGRVDESSLRSVDPALGIYDRSKWEAERLLREVVGQGLDVVICNPTGIFGPVDHGQSRVNSVVRQAALGRMPVVPVGGFDMVDVRDVARALTLAAEKGRTGENYLLAGHAWTMRDLCTEAARANGRRGPVVTTPLAWLQRLSPLVDPPMQRFLKDESMSRLALEALGAFPTIDGSKAREELGFVPRPREETVGDLVAHLRETGRLGRR